MRIQELEQFVGMDRATIRFYEKEGLIAPVRSENGYRNYTQEIADELRKIRLLRQLGMSVYTIRLLQQGSADFSEAMTTQIQRLSDQIEEHKRAKAVCQTMQEDKAEYGTLDAAHYLNLLQTIQPEAPSAGFQEKVPRQIHPWRRWLARTLDYWWLGNLIHFIIVVLLRIRPLPNDFEDALIAVFAGALFIPIEALMLHKFGTTPGKFVMGIRLESVNGGNLPLKAALTRAWRVYKEGMFFCIPFLKNLRQLYQYFRLTGRTVHRFARKEDIPDPVEMIWDGEAEIIYTPVAGKKGILLAALIAATILTGVFTGLDGIKPKYRTDQLTVAQFAENYNQVMTFFQGEDHLYDTLNPDGTRKPYDPSAYVIYSGYDQEHDSLSDFLYETENGILKSVTIRKYWNEGILHVNPMGTEEVNLIFTMLLSQPECGISDFWGIIEILRTNETKREAQLSYRDMIEIEWVVDARNCTQVSTEYVTTNAGEPSSLYYSITVRIS